MIGALRVAGYTFIVAGVISFAFYLVPPLRNLWPVVLSLPLPIRIGAIAVAAGLAIILGSMISERVRTRVYNQSLKDDFHEQ